MEKTTLTIYQHSPHRYMFIFPFTYKMSAYRLHILIFLTINRTLVTLISILAKPII